MMRYFKYILIVVLAISCNNNSIEKPKKPKNLIQKDKMADIIFDMSIFTAAKGVNKKIIESNGILPEEYIYKKYDIDSSQFAQSNEYYAFNLESYEEIYSKVKERLEAKKVYYDSVIDAEAKQRIVDGKEFRKRRDSIINNVDSKNLLNYSEDFMKTDWVKMTCNVISNSIVSPFKDSKASKLLAASSNSIQHRLDQTVNYPKGKVTFSVYVKASEYSKIRLRIGSAGIKIIFDLKRGIIIGMEKGVKAKISDEKNGWYRCSISLVSTGSETCRVNIDNGISLNFIGDEGGVYIHGVQLEKGDTPTEYSKKERLIKKEKKKIDLSKEKPLKKVTPSRLKKVDKLEKSIRQ